MLLRIVLAGILGGILVFFCGAFSHMALNWGGRAFSVLPNEAAVREFVREQQIQPGLYSFPWLNEDLPADQLEAERERVNKLYKQGPSAFLVVQPTGEDMMSGSTLLKEVLSNILAALLAAWIVAQVATDRGFVTRWAVVLLLGLFSWLSISASYEIWYRFPMPFVRDELLGSLLEWGVAGLVIAALVRRRTPTAN